MGRSAGDRINLRGSGVGGRIEDGVFRKRSTIWQAGAPALHAASPAAGSELRRSSKNKRGACATFRAPA
ncbi:MAG: hypothetical protein DMF27_13205 [Verrucomicrobia bacterium]|nr:MAG: hypothetical protein DMF27_13205 [Verrucomicrobiota bacterium]